MRNTHVALGDSLRSIPQVRIVKSAFKLNILNMMWYLNMKIKALSEQ